MEINAKLVSDLRQKTGAGMMDCKKALAETAGDFEKAVEFLRKKGLAASQKKASRIASVGAVGSYIHAGGKIGVLVEVNTETDFVAKNAEFQAFVKDVCMHIAASAPRFVQREDVPAAEVEKEKEILAAQAAEQGKKPPQVIEKIVQGRIDKFFSDICLLEQPFVREPEKKVGDILNGLVAKIGEKIVVRRFVRFQLGEGLAKRGEDFAAEVAKAASGN